MRYPFHIAALLLALLHSTPAAAAAVGAGIVLVVLLLQISPIDLGLPRRTTLLLSRILGLATPLLPMVGADALLLLLAITLLSADVSGLQSSALPARYGASSRTSINLTLLGISGCWCLGYLLSGELVDSVRSSWSFAANSLPERAFHVWMVLAHAPPQSFIAFLSLAKLWLLFSALQLFMGHEPLRNNLIVGLRGGFAVALPLVLGQIFLPRGASEGVGWLVQAEWLPTRQTAYWSSLGQYVGSFTDPNAFGVSAALVLPILTSATSPLFRWALMGGWLIAGAFSGSRTFFLLLLLAGAFRVWRSSRRAFVALSLTGIGVCGLLQGAPLILHSVGVSPGALPIGLERTIASVTFSSFAQAWHSREVFWGAAMEAFLDNPLTGIGFSRFRSEAPLLLQQHGIPLGAWSDNANNFYLGVAAEMGVLGLIALGVTFRSFAWQRDISPLTLFGKDMVMAFLVALFFGPHIEFPEVIVLIAALGSVSLRSAERSHLPAPLAPRLVLAGALILYASCKDIGVWGWEQEGSQAFRWSARRARLRLPCSNGAAHVELRSFPEPNLPEPLVVAVGASGQAMRSHVLIPTRPLSLTLLCGDTRWSADNIPVTLSFSRAWIPALTSGGDDWRTLGAQIRTIAPAP